MQDVESLPPAPIASSLPAPAMPASEVRARVAPAVVPSEATPREQTRSLATLPPPDASTLMPGLRISRATAWMAAATVLAALGYGGVRIAGGMHVEATDNAKVAARVVTLSAEVGGVVQRVAVHDNELVEAGAVLAQIDPRPYELAVARARAELLAAEAAASDARTRLGLIDEQTSATLASARGEEAQAAATRRSHEAEIAGAEAARAVAESLLEQAERELARASTLQGQGSLSDAELDRVRARREEAVATLERARAQVAAASAMRAAAAGAEHAALGRLRLVRSRDARASIEAELSAAQARVEQANVALSLAELDLARTKIVAPTRGVVARRTIEPGAYVAPNAPVLALVSPDDVWVEAQFKEGQVGRLRPGQRAVVKVDAYGARVFPGVIESIAGATTSRFAPIASENAAGSFVKVTQRVPVVVRLDGKADVALRPGLSANVSVDVGDASP